MYVFALKSKKKKKSLNRLDMRRLELSLGHVCSRSELHQVSEDRWRRQLGVHVTASAKDVKPCKVPLRSQGMVSPRAQSIHCGHVLRISGDGCACCLLNASVLHIRPLSVSRCNCGISPMY